METTQMEDVTQLHEDTEFLFRLREAGEYGELKGIDKLTGTSICHLEPHIFDHFSMFLEYFRNDFS